jgi:hypothetical protein
MSKILVSYYSDFAYGELEGLFITTREELKAAFGKTVYWGEVLGKHSEVSEELDESLFSVKSDDPVLITALEQAFGSPNISGYNPLLQNLK